jgi:hypothetical protein
MSEAIQGARTLFEVHFASAMTEDNLAVLSSRLGLTTRLAPQAGIGQGDGRFARLDNSSSLFLQRGTTEGTWILEGRTWGEPSPLNVHDWHVVTAYAAQLLDPTVRPPERQPATASSTPQRSVSASQNKRFSRIRRRLVGMT